MERRGRRIRTGADNVRRECHGEERGYPVAELHHEDIGLWDDLIEGIQDADASRCAQML